MPVLNRREGTTIQLGDRVSFVQRKATWIGTVFLPERVLSGEVRLLDGHLAWVATEPGGLWHMAEVDKLEKEMTP